MKQFVVRIAAIVAGFALIFQFLPVAAVAQDGRQLNRENTKTVEARTALVIGNGKYQKVSPLDNPVNDAADMAAALRDLGFEVLSGTDANRIQMLQLINEFGEKLATKKGTGLVFYAGHGVEVRGKNFLIPIDADIKREVETEIYAIDVNSILRQMDEAGNGFNIVILDACRNNPFSRGWNRSADTGGLANVTAPTGTYIAYAAAPGTTASDGKGTRNGVFTGALLKNLRRPDLKLEEVFKATREEVMTVTSDKQVPWDVSSIKGDFYFSPDLKVARPDGNPNTTPAKTVQIEGERAFWKSIEKSTDPEDFRAYLKAYPNGEFAPLAENNIRKLRNPPKPANTSPTNDALKKVDTVSALDEFTPAEATPASIKARIDRFWTELQNSPDATGYIVIYGPPDEVAEREKFIRDHFKFRKYPLDKVVFENGGTEGEIRHQFWLVPPGAKPPLSDDRSSTQSEPAKTDQRRIALVIGNGKYQHTTKLDNPVNDAADMTAALKSLGFEVFSGVDQNKQQMENLIRDFGQRLAITKGVGLFFYAGHGISAGGENYLIPVDANIRVEDQLANGSVPLGLLLGKFKTANNSFNMVFLDACRSNPFARSWSGGNGKGGLALVNAPNNMLISYATTPGSVVSEPSQRNSLFTEALLRQIRVKGVDVTKMMKSVRMEVSRKSNNQQVPFDQVSMQGDFYFAGKN